MSTKKATSTRKPARGRPAAKAKPTRRRVVRDAGDIDDIDRALVERLRRDGREGNRALATALGVNEATIASRLRRLEQEAIMRVVALTDIEAFGYDLLAFVKLRVTGRPLLEVADELGDLPETMSVTVVTGRYDLVVPVLARDRHHLSQITGVDIPKVRGVDTTGCELAIDVLRFESMWAALNAGEYPAEPRSESDAVDELDLSIIGLLQRDARSSNRRIAAEVGVSEGTIRARIGRMEDERIIRIQAISDVVAFGLQAHAYVGVQVAAGQVAVVQKALLKCDEIAVLARTIGDFDFFAVVPAENRERLIDVILNRIATIPGVRRTETFESWRTLKHAYTWARLV